MASTENFYKIIEFIRKNIPNKVCIRKITSNHIMLRSDIKDFDEAMVFVRTYEAVTHTNFKICTSRFARKKQWICSNKCPAKITIVFKSITKYTKVKDPFLRRDPPFQAVIKVDSTHNHLLIEPDSLTLKSQQLKIDSPVRECFFEYFKRGIYGADAKSFHEKNLQKANFHALNDISMNPSLLAIDALTVEWKITTERKKRWIENSLVRKAEPSVLDSKQLMNVNAQVKECFYEFFKRGVSSIAAKSFHEENLKKANFHAFGDWSMNPPISVIKLLHRDWMKRTNSIQLEKESLLSETALVYNSEQIDSNFGANDIICKHEIDFEENTVANLYNASNEEDVKPIINIKKEIEEDDDGDSRLPVIESYGSVAPPPLPVENAASFSKISPSNSQVVICGKTSDTYKTIKYLSSISKYMSSTNYPSNQYCFYLPISDARIAYQKV